MNSADSTDPDFAHNKALLDRLIDEASAVPRGAAILQSLEPAQIEADYGRAWEMLSAGELSAAADAFGELARRAPDQHRVHFGFALCLQHHGLVDDALRHYGLAFALDPSSAACAFRMGECLWARGDHEDAREAMLTAIELCSIEGNDPQIIGWAQSTLDEWTSGSARP